jgi:T-complex protein 1 subunit gamma
MQAPVFVLNTGTKREQGRKAQLSNITAAKTVSDIIRTTLGPQSMLKMMLDPMGGIVLTNDGNAILREIDVSHPAAKSMIELSRTQDEEVGDGTTSVIILAGEMLKQARPFFERNMHPRVVVYAYYKALEVAMASLAKVAKSVDVNDNEALLGIVRGCLGTKFVSRFGDLTSKLAIDAVRRIIVERKDGTKEIDIKRYARVERIPGGFLDDSKVLDGIMLNKDITHSKMRRRIENPRIVLLDCPLEFKKGESQTNIEITAETDWDVILKMEEEYVERLCNHIIALKPDLVFTEKGVSDLASHYFVKAGISCIRRLRKTDNNRIARAVGATIVHEPSELKDADIGTECGLFEIRKIGDEYFTFLVECQDPKACSILLRGASKDVLQEVDRNLRDAMCVVRNVFFDNAIVPGGGAAEMAVGKMLREEAKSIDDVHQWPFEAVANALEVIPKTLIENCGANTIREITALRAKHANGEHTFGINGVTGKPVDMNELNVWDPLAVKQQTIKTAIESACMLLRIDDIVSGTSAAEQAQLDDPDHDPNDHTFGDARDG